MITIHTPEIMQKFSLEHKHAGKKIAFVPTMGYLHEGHATLLREAKKNADIVVLSIFVNPIQFGANEDLDRYPRDFDRDCAIAEECQADIIYYPEPSQMYPEGFQTNISLSRISLPLCGAKRPGHFDGVATVVAKLFNIVQPDVAIFGKKDFQQLALIRQMVKDLNFPIEIIGIPIVREPDQLAMSSRNAYLSETERKAALSLSKSIDAIKQLYNSGEKDVDKLRKCAIEIISSEPLAKIDYIELRDSERLNEILTADDNTVIALAVFIGKTRLIDNRILGEEN